MKHYYNPMSRAITTDWMLKELDVEHQQVIIDYADTSSKEFREINPMGKLPVLVDGDAVVTETAAICSYLADKYIEKGLAPALDSPLRASYYRYLFTAGNTVEPAITLAHAQLEHPEPETAGWGDMARVLATIEVMTPANNWALGEKFSAADVVYGGLLDFSSSFGLLKASPKVLAYIERIRERPAYKESHLPFAK